MADCETPLARSSSVNFDGVRATSSARQQGSPRSSEKYPKNVRAVQKKPAFNARTKAAALVPPVAPKKATRGLLECMDVACMARV